MRRMWALAAVVVLVPACGDSSGDSGTQVLNADVARHPPPSAGQSGSSLTYPDGHPLDWMTDDAAVLAYEEEVFGLVNEHRESLGLIPLVHDPVIRRCARGHSRHMRSDVHAFVAHVNPEGHGPGDRLLLCGVPDLFFAGENVAAGTATPVHTFNAWLASPPHRGAIENPDWRRTGVGYQPGPPGDTYRHYWTQNFAN